MAAESNLSSTGSRLKLSNHACAKNESGGKTPMLSVSLSEYMHACIHAYIHTYCSCLVLSTFNVQCTTGVINFLIFFEPMQHTGSCSHAFPGFNFLNPPPLASVAEMNVVRLPALVLQVANPSSRSHFLPPTDRELSLC